MADKEDIATLLRQEAELVFEGFDEQTAFTVGNLICDAARMAGHPIVVDIRFWDRQLFYAAMPGSKPDNAEWVRRKCNVVRRFYRSTYAIVLENRGRPYDFEQKGLDPADHVLAGGGFPIRIRGVGVVGAITVSGVPEREDHGLVVRAIAHHLGRDYEDLALPPD